MEGIQKQETKEVGFSANSESVEFQESVEKAKTLHAEVLKFHNTDVVGIESFNEVQNMAFELSELLKSIPLKVRQQAGLPWHPLDDIEAANDETYPIEVAA